jgi:hypothetical protein
MRGAFFFAHHSENSYTVGIRQLLEELKREIHLLTNLCFCKPIYKVVDAIFFAPI